MRRVHNAPGPAVGILIYAHTPCPALENRRLGVPSNGIGADTEQAALKHIRSRLNGRECHLAGMGREFISHPADPLGLLFEVDESCQKMFAPAIGMRREFDPADHAFVTHA